jgi:hypothetical protein
LKPERQNKGHSFACFVIHHIVVSRAETRRFQHGSEALSPSVTSRFNLHRPTMMAAALQAAHLHVAAQVEFETKFEAK